MGLRNSKNSKSYDIAPVADKEFNYKRTSRLLPKIELPVVVVTSEENVDDSIETSAVQKLEVQHIQTTSLVVETSDYQPDKQFAEIAQEVDAQQLQTASLVVETCDNNDEISKPHEDTQDPRIPLWVNKSNFQKFMKQTHSDIEEIITFEAYSALGAGENYTTLMLIVKITAKLQDDSTKDYSFMLKVAHDNEQMKAMLEGPINMFVIENAVYTDILPAMEKIYRQAGVDVNFGAKSYKLPTDESNPNFVLLDDLGVYGFKNANRLECLDMEHTLLVLQKLAQFHAASACYATENGPYSEVFSPNMDNEIARNILNQMFSSFKQPFLDNLKTYNNGERYYDEMENVLDNLVKEFINSRKPRPGYFNVLNHGDLWSNNILFKYTDDGKVEQAVFVDFQNTNWGSPAQDLFYFIISSTQIDIKLSQYDYFICYYYKHLTENLNLLKYPLEIQSLREFHMQLIDFGSWATFSSIFILGVVLSDPTDNAKFENFLNDTMDSVDFKNSVFSNKRYHKYINEILPWLHNRGFMELSYSDLDNKTLSTDKLGKVTTTTTTAIVEQKSYQSSFSYPEWVKESLFIDVIRADFENYQKILKFSVSRDDDNYLSAMLKIDIDIESSDNNRHTLSYMLKIPPNGEQAKSIRAMINSFDEEITVYHEIVTQFQKVYKEQAGIDIVFGPTCYKLAKETECDTLVLENLKIKGFKNCDRLEGLDIQHTRAVLKKLAEFHAASAYLFATKGRFPEVFERSMYNEETKESREKSMETFLKIFTDCVQEYDNKDEYFDNVLNYAKNAPDLLEKANTIDWTKFNVLNHGSCWTNNIMFQYDEQGEISNTYFVDFQLIKYGPPAYDLYYFLLSSPKLELKLEQFDYFIRYYYEHLKANLELLKYPNEIPTLRQLHIDLLDNGTLAMTAVMGVMTAVLLEPTDIANSENIISNDDQGIAMKKQMFLNKRYRTHAEDIYPWLKRRGLLEFK